MNTMSGEHLQNLFATEPWRNLFTTLSDNLGFSLSVYARTGEPIVAPAAPLSPCVSLRAASPRLEGRCRSSCHPRIMNALATGKPDVFKCYTGIMSFALPIEYREDKAVILGQGSFSSYEDFRNCMDLVTSEDLDTFSITAPLLFTSQEQASKACRFVESTVNRLLTNQQEAASLRQKVDSLMSVFSLWGSASVERPELRYQDMLYNLSTLLDLDRITILALDRRTGRYESLYGLSKGGAQTESLSIDANDLMVTELLGGRPFVRATDPQGTTRSYFPVMANGTLAGILAIADRVLSENDRQIISGFCKQTALFIENYQLHQDLYKKLNRFATMSELAQAMTPIQHYGTLLQMILDKSAELLKAEQGSLMMLDRETDALLLEAKKGGTLEGLPEKIRIRRGEGIAGKVAEQGEPILVQNLEDDPRIRQKNREHYKTRSFVSIPLKIADRVIGVLNLSDKTTGEVFDEEDLKLVQSFATQAVVVMERNEFYNRSEELKKLTITDSLTGLVNRRYLLERLKDEIARSERHVHPMSLLMIDLDGFKHCNDTQGHLFGDRMLKTVADILLGAVRSMDVVARFGGDEFMVILPETDLPVAVAIAERLKNTIAAGTVLTEGGINGGRSTLTASIGIVCFPEHGDTIELLLERVDQSLYRAKNGGKNRIEVYA